jgi:diguanylate cyclase
LGDEFGAPLALLRSVIRSWIAGDRRRRVFAYAAGATLVASVAYALILRNVYFGDQVVTALDDIGEAVAAGLAAAACAWAVRRARGRDRLGWALMSVSAGLWGAGEIVWSIYEVGLQVEVPYPSLADAGFLAAVPFAIGGIRAFWGPPRGTAASWRIWFDGLIVAIALVSTAWGFGLRTVWESGSPTIALDLAYPISDILIGTVLILAIRRAPEHQRGRMALLLAGVACYSIADSAFAYLTAEGAFGAVGSTIDTGWFAGYLLIGLAAIFPESPPRPAAKEAPIDLWQLALPWMTLLTAAAGDFYTAVSGHEGSVFQIGLTGILALLLTANMIFERREFLEMLTDIETSHATLKEEFRTTLLAIRRVGKQIPDSALAAEIHRHTERLDLMIEEIVEEDEEIGRESSDDRDVSLVVQAPGGVAH